MDKNMILNRLPLFWLLAASLITFVLYGIDKRKAARGKWRIRESTLLLCAFFGGAAGAFLAMRLFRHKTRKWYFAVGVPLMLLMQAGLLWYLYMKG